LPKPGQKREYQRNATGDHEIAEQKHELPIDFPMGTPLDCWYQAIALTIAFGQGEFRSGISGFYLPGHLPGQITTGSSSEATRSKAVIL
jgi:hypothetical protein